YCAASHGRQRHWVVASSAAHLSRLLDLRCQDSTAVLRQLPFQSDLPGIGQRRLFESFRIHPEFDRKAGRSQSPARHRCGCRRCGVAWLDGGLGVSLLRTETQSAAVVGPEGRGASLRIIGALRRHAAISADIAALNARCAASSPAWCRSCTTHLPPTITSLTQPSLPPNSQRPSSLAGTTL